MTTPNEQQKPPEPKFFPTLKEIHTIAQRREFKSSANKPKCEKIKVVVRRASHIILDGESAAQLTDGFFTVTMQAKLFINVKGQQEWRWVYFGDIDLSELPELKPSSRLLATGLQGL